MGKISSDFGSGGANLDPSGGDARTDSLVTILRDIADDLDGVQIASAIAAPAATDLATTLTLVNEIRTKLNATAGYTLKTVKT